MKRIVVRRLMTIPFTVLFVSVMIFVLTAVVPGDPARIILGREADERTVENFREELGLDQPLVVQYVSWLGDFVTGDWGESYSMGEPVTDIVVPRLGRSLLLGGFAFLLLVPVSLAIGIIAAFNRGKRWDRGLTVTSLALSCVPEFVTGVLLLVVFGVNLGWFPVSAAAPPGSNVIAQLHRLVLPSVALLLAWAGYLGRITRTATVATLDSHYVRTARLKGLRRTSLISRHVLRNSLMVPITLFGVALGAFLGGLTVVETLFNYQGLGRLFVDATMDRDIPVLQAVALLVGLISMVCILATDLLYGLLDPRVRTGEVDQ